jgi:WXG100 family type VII secretion target
MTVPVIQAHYEQLERIANKFRDQQEVVASQQRAIQQAYQPLAQGGWQGKGSQAFISEMEQEMFPALDRLHYALSEGEAAVRQIIAIMRAAEEEASQPFRNGFGDTVGVASTLGAGAGAHVNGSNDAVGAASALGAGAGTGAGAHVNGSSDTGSGLHYSGSSSDGIARSVVDVHSLFAPEKMKQMVGRTWQGQGSAQLRNAMNVLNGDPTPEQVEKALDDIAEARGVDRKKIAADYEVFKQKKQQMVNKYGEPDSGSASFIPFLHSDYMGSRDQLRFGQIVGDAFNIDPVFGALLEPTGGMPGAGNQAIPANESILSYHAAYHDAAGFLYTNFGQGPGYDYLGQEAHRPTDHGLTGQETGLKFWSNVMLQRDAQAFINNPWNSSSQLQMLLRTADATISIVGGIGLGEYSDFSRSEVGQITLTALKYSPPGLLVRKGLNILKKVLE